MIDQVIDYTWKTYVNVSLLIAPQSHEQWFVGS